jgi:hypothetical protein
MEMKAVERSADAVATLAERQDPFHVSRVRNHAPKRKRSPG